MVQMVQGSAGVLQSQPNAVQQNALDPTKLVSLMMQIREMKNTEEQQKRANSLQALQVISGMAEKGMMTPEMADAASKHMKAAGIDLGGADKTLGTKGVSGQDLMSVGQAMGNQQQGAQAATPVTQRSSTPEGGGVQAQTPQSFSDMLMEHSNAIRQSNIYKAQDEAGKAQIDKMRNDLMLQAGSKDPQVADEAAYRLGKMSTAADPSKFNLQFEAFHRANPETKGKILESEAADMSFGKVQQVAVQLGQEGTKAGMFKTPAEGNQYYNDILTKGRSDIVPKPSTESIVNTANAVKTISELNIKLPTDKVAKLLEGGASLSSVMETFGQGKSLMQASLEIQQRQASAEERRASAEEQRGAAADRRAELAAQADIIRAAKEYREEHFKEQELALKDNAGLREAIEGLGKMKNPPSPQLMESLEQQLMGQYGWRKETVKNWLGSIIGSAGGLGERQEYQYYGRGEQGTMSDKEEQDLVDRLGGKKTTSIDVKSNTLDKSKQLAGSDDYIKMLQSLGQGW